MDLSCLVAKFCSEKLGENNPEYYKQKIEANLKEFKDYIQNEFVEKALGYLALGEYSFVYKRKLKYVLSALKLDIHEALASQIYTIIKKAQGIANAPRFAPVRWIGENGFVQFRNQYYKDICEIFPGIRTSYTKIDVVPDSTISAANHKKVYDKVKTIPLAEIEKQVNIFCQGD